MYFPDSEEYQRWVEALPTSVPPTAAPATSSTMMVMAAPTQTDPSFLEEAPIPSSTTDPVTQMILDTVLGLGSTTTAQPEPQAQEQTEDSPNLSDAMVIAGGSVVLLHHVDRWMRSAYYNAVYASDPRLMGLGVRQPTWATTAWQWTATGLRQVWVPLWFSHEGIRERALRDAVQDAQMRHEISEILNNPPSIHPNYREDDIDDWREAIQRDRERARQNTPGPSSRFVFCNFLI